MIMEKIFSIDQMRLVFTTPLSTLAAYFSPTKGFFFISPCNNVRV